MARKNKLILKKENKFKSLLINVALTASLIGGAYFGVNALKGIMEIHEQGIASAEQAQIVTDAINEDYEDISLSENENINQQQQVQEQHKSKFDFEKMWEINPNIVGVIEGDCFEGGYYPVVSTNSFEEENDYLYHSIDGNDSYTGTIFSDYRSDNSMQSDVTALWGHNMHGQAKRMFDSLTNYKDQNYYNEHKTLKYYTPNGEYNLNIFAYIEDDPRNQTIGNYPSNDEKVNAMKDISNSSMISTRINVKADDRVMILYTCTDLGSINDPYNRSAVYTILTPVWENKITQAKTL